MGQEERGRRRGSWGEPLRVSPTQWTRKGWDTLKRIRSPKNVKDQQEDRINLLILVKKMHASSKVLQPSDIDEMWEAFSQKAKTQIGDIAFGEQDLQSFALSFPLINELLAQRCDIKAAEKLNPDLVNALQREIADEIWNEHFGKGSVNSDPSLDFDGYVRLVNALKTGKIPESMRRKPLIPFDPESRWKNAWDIFLMVLLLYTCFSVPYMLAFVQDQTMEWTPFNIFDVCLDIVFMLDVVFSFLTSYQEAGMLVTDLPTISMHYLRTWFLADVAGSFPFDKVITAAYAAQGLEATVDLNSMRILKAVRMLKLLRAMKFANRFSQLEQREGFAAFKKSLKIAKTGFIMIFIAHVFGCLFTMLIDRSDTDNWLYHYDHEVFYQDNFSRYMVALYWAIITISTMGYGDVLPVTHTERMFAVFVAVFGAVTFSYCMGIMTSLITKSSDADAKFEDALRMISEYVEFRKLPADTKLKVKRHLHQCLRRSPPLYEENSVLDMLPNTLRSEVLKQLSVNEDYKPPFFHGLQPECLGSIMTLLDMQQFEKGQCIYQAEEVGSDMYMIVSGSVQVCPHDNLNEDRLTPIDHRQVSNLGVGESFGEICLFSEICRYRGETVAALEETTVLVLSASKLVLIKDAFPVVEEKIRNLCMLISLDRKLNNGVMENKIFYRNQEGHATVAGFEKRSRELSDKLFAESEYKLTANLEEGVTQCGPRVFKLWWLIAHNKNTDPSYMSPNTRPLNLFPSAREGEVWQRVTFIILTNGEIRYISDTIQSLSAPEASTMGLLRVGSSCTKQKRHGLSRVQNVGLGGVSRRRYSSEKLVQSYICTLIVFEDELGAIPKEVILAADSYAELEETMSTVNGLVYGLGGRNCVLECPPSGSSVGLGLKDLMKNAKDAVEIQLSARSQKYLGEKDDLKMGDVLFRRESNDSSESPEEDVEDVATLLHLKDVQVHAQDYKEVDAFAGARPLSKASILGNSKLSRRLSTSASACGDIAANNTSAEKNRVEMREIKVQVKSVDDRVTSMEQKLDTLVRKMDVLLSRHR